MVELPPPKHEGGGDQEIEGSILTSPNLMDTPINSQK